LVGDPGEDASGTAGIHPQQTSGRLPPHLSERLHSSDDEAPWNDRHGRKATGACRNRNGSFGDPKLPRLLLGVRELGLTAKASCQEVARHLRRVNFDVASYINDKRATVEFSKRVAGAMARRAARIAYERAGGK
jgi:hypothetical protein